MAKEEVTILYGVEARKKLQKGIEKVNKAVAITLGPKGKNVIIEQEFGSPEITKDGVSVAKRVFSNDPIENIVIGFLQGAADKTNTRVGDGTTTTTVLAYAILMEASKSLAAGANPMDLKRGIDRAANHTISVLKRKAEPIKGHDSIKQVATVASNGDVEIGELIAKGFVAVGENGVITVKEAKSTTTELELTKGMKFDRGYSSPYFLLDQKKKAVTLENAYVLIVKDKITNAQLSELVPLLEQVAKSGRSLLIISEEVEAHVLTALILNVMRGVLKVVAVKAPGFGDYKDRNLEDIAILTGGSVVAAEKGHQLKSVTLSDLGSAESVTVDKESTTIVGGKGDKSKVEARIEQLRVAIAEASSDYDRDKLKESLAKLAGGVAVINVGDATELAMKEKRDRVEDAINATRAAVAGGILPGGGVAYLRAIKEVKDAIDSFDNPDQVRGGEIFLAALEAPARRIAENAGEEASVVVQKIKEGSGAFGYNAQLGRYEDLYKAGIKDAYQVLACALETAASIAGTIVTTDCIVPQKPKEKESTPPAMGGGMM